MSAPPMTLTTADPRSPWSIPAHRFAAVDFVGVYLVLLLLIPSRLIISPIGAVGTPATIWGLLGVLWWISASIAGLRIPTGRNPVSLMLALLAVSISLAYVAGMTKGWYSPADIRGDTDDIYDLVPSTVTEVRAVMMSAANRGAISATVWIGMAMVIIQGLRTRRDLDRLVGWLTGIGAILASIAIVQFFTGLNIDGWYRLPGLSASEAFGAVDSRSVVRRVYSTAKHPIEFGVLMGALFPLALHRSFFRRTRVAHFSATAIGLAATMSISRSAILVVAVALVVLLVGWPPRWRLRFLMATPFAVVGVRLVAPGVVGTLRSLFSGASQDPSVAGRTADYDIATRIIGENPVFGRGLFTFVPRYYRILDNQFLMIALELGYLGLLTFVGLAAASLFAALASRRRSGVPEERHLSLALAASIAGITVSYATFDTWGFPMAAGLSFTLYAMAGAGFRMSNVASRVSSEPMDATRALQTDLVHHEHPPTGRTRRRRSNRGNRDDHDQR